MKTMTMRGIATQTPETRTLPAEAEALNGFPCPVVRTVGRRAHQVWAALWLVIVALGTPASAGLKLRLEGGGGSDVMVVSNLALHVATGGSASPFLAAGPTVAEWTGAVVVDLRGDYEFQAVGQGMFELEIQGAPVVRFEGNSASGAWSAPVRLRKGPNPMRAVLKRTGTEEVSVRMQWRGRGMSPRPIPESALQLPAALEDVAPAAQRRDGRDLFLHLRCGHCHGAGPAGSEPGALEDGPDLEGIAARRRPGWLAAWIENPTAQRSDARMPRLLSGPTARDDAQAIEAWMSSAGGAAVSGGTGTLGNAEVGRSLFGSLACTRCHVPPGEPAAEGKVGLGQVTRKFSPAALIGFLIEPTAHDRWSRMPDFGLSSEEAGQLAAYLLAGGVEGAAVEAGRGAVDPARAARGRELVETRGCLNCHAAAPLKTRFQGKPIGALTGAALERGCLTEGDAAVAGSASSPRYTLTPGERTALRAFLADGSGAASRRVPSDDARRWMEELRCRSCHEGAERLEGIPVLTGAGGKLRPEWTSNLLSGALTVKTRPWLGARMPAWKGYAGRLSAGLAALEGHPPVGPAEGSVDVAAAAEGRKLVSAAGGLACVTCHPIGGAGASAVFEAPGVNFALVAERLLPEYAARWIRDPQSVDPGTKMPLYFDEAGNSPLTEFFGGDGPKTIDALWQYLRMGPRIQPPEK